MNHAPVNLDIELLENSFRLVAPHGEALVNRFYERLFEKYPEVKPLFRHVDMAQQRKKLLGSLQLVIQNLRKPEALTPALKALGGRHVRYGAKPAHYIAVRENLLAVFGEFAGSAWTAEVKQAWADALTLVNSLMLEGAQEASPNWDRHTWQGSTTMGNGGNRPMGIWNLFQHWSLTAKLVVIFAILGAIPMVMAGYLGSRVGMAPEGITFQHILWTTLGGLTLTFSFGFLANRIVSRRLRRVSETMTTMADGTLDVRVGEPAQDEIGQIGLALDTMAEGIQHRLDMQEVRIKELTKAQEHMIRIKAALDNTRTNVMICDRNYTIVFANQNSLTTLRNLEQEIQKVLPNFRADRVVGSSIDAYHKNPSHQRRLLDDPHNLPYRTEITIGPLTLDLRAAAIMSESGEYLGNVVEWADVTAQKQAQTEVEQLIQAAAAGRLDQRIDVDRFDGFFRALSAGINHLLEQWMTPLHETQRVLVALAQGDLTQTMSDSYQGEFKKIQDNLNKAIMNLAATVTAVRDRADQVSTAAAEITKGNDDLSSRTSEQASSLEETSASMEQMTATIKQNAENAKQASHMATTAREIAEKGGTVTEQAVTAMEEITTSSKKIADIINVIDEIAFQTNLLALNAAVEAARAGEQGRGFAVVASEVRNLAQRSATAAKEIKALIHESVQKVGDGNDLVHQSGETLQNIVKSVKQVATLMDEISTASQEQAAGIDQVNKAIMQMDQVTQQNAALVEETAAASQSLKEQSMELLHTVEFFHVADDQHRTALSGSPKAKFSAMKQQGSRRRSANESLSRPSIAPSRVEPLEVPLSTSVSTGNGRTYQDEPDDFFKEF